MKNRRKIIIIVICFLAGFLIGLLGIFLYANSFRHSIPNYLHTTMDVGDAPSNEADIILKETVQEVLYPSHYAPHDEQRYYQRLDVVCRTYSDLCDTITLVGDFSLEDSFFYKTISVFVAAKLDRYYPNASLTDTLERFTITNNGGRRGSATRHNMTINTDDIDDYQEFLEIIMHELGHIVDLGLIQGNSHVYHQSFTEFGRAVFALDDPSLSFYQLTWKSENVRKSQVDKYDFCSGYGQSNPFEDFAECFNLYMDHNALFRSLARKNNILKKKYNIIADFFNGKYFYDSQRDIRLLVPGSSFFVFDTTHISKM